VVSKRLCPLCTGGTTGLSLGFIAHPAEQFEGNTRASRQERGPGRAQLGSTAVLAPLDLNKLLKNPVFRKYFTEGLALEQFPVGKIFFVYFFLRLHQDGLFNFIGNHNDTVEISKDQVAGFY
jgi:hypothetical protein